MFQFAQIDIGHNVTLAYVVPYLIAYLALPFIFALPAAIATWGVRNHLEGVSVPAGLIAQLTARWGFQTIGLNVVGWILVVAVANSVSRDSVLFWAHESVETAYALTILSLTLAVLITVWRRSF